MTTAKTVVTTIREVIHYGDYYNEREVPFHHREDGTATYESMLIQMGETSPYRFDFDPWKNKYHAQALAAFTDKGTCEIGWATFEVLP